MPDDRVEQAIEAIRASGGRITVDRRAIVQALVDHGDHRTVEELAQAVWVDHPGVNLATIYRTVELLEQLGIGFHVHVGHGPSLWHLSEHIHQHLVCDSCGTVIDVPDDSLDPLRRQLLESTGFEIDLHHFSMVGRCADCAGRSPDGEPAGPGGDPA
jgi:Fe2+ or Zn2+ uptake regulation protein